MRSMMIFLAMVYPLVLLSQAQKPFKIIGTYNLDTIREIRIYETFFLDSALYNHVLDKNTIDVRNNKFEITGTVDYPTPFCFSYYVKEKNRVVTSGLLFIEGGDVDITLKDFTKDNNVIVNSKSHANEEYHHIKTLCRNANEVDERDKILKTYIIGHPNSYVAMWGIIDDYYNFDYYKLSSSDKSWYQLMDSISYLFSPTIRKNKAFQAFQKKLKINNSIKLGDSFPFGQFSFGNSMMAAVHQAKFTLIDFWATYCKPCIAQFPVLKEMYSKLNSKGFSVYSVSLDREENLPYMHKILKGKGILWQNAWDNKGQESKKLNISGIPRNFLVNQAGKIIAENINIEELEEILEEKLN